MFLSADRLRKALAEESLAGVGRAGLCDRVKGLAEVRSAIDAFEARLIRAVDDLNDNGVDGAGILRTVGRVSSRSAASASKLADNLANLPQTSQALADGRITIEHAATVSRAAARVSAERADSELIDRAGSCPADVFAKQTRSWMARNVSVDDGIDELARQKAKRSACWFTDDDGLRCVLARFDPVTGKQIEKRIQHRYDELLRNDGGRAGKPDEVRSHDQRLADAIAEVLVETAGSRCSAPRPHPKAQLLVIADLGRITLENPTGSAEMLGHGPIPQPVLERLACSSEMAAVLFDGPGRPIWVGREHRSATTVQWRALIARDRGCVGCDADPSRCEAHHIVPWKSMGSTDITNLVLVCSRCHHDIHDRGASLNRSEDGSFQIEYRAGPVAIAA